MYGVGKDGSFKYAKQEIKTCQLQKIHNLAKKPGTHNPLNRLIEKSDSYNVIERLEYNDLNLQIKSYDALGNLTQYEYDKNNRLKNTIDPDNHTTSQTYDNAGNIATKTDGRKNTTKYEYDEYNRLVKVKNAKNEETTYTYDPNGNMLTQTDGKGNTTTYEYNAANKVARKTDHGGRTLQNGNYAYDTSKTETYTYYADGNLKSKTDRNGNTTEYIYDIHGRLISQTAGKASITYTYDNNGNQLTITDSTGTTTRTYDELNRVKTKEVPFIGTTTFVYDIISGDGTVAETAQDPKGNRTTKEYDKAGRLSKVKDGDINSANATVYEYYGNGARKSVTYPNGLKEEYEYEKDGLLKTLTNIKPDGTVLDKYSYTYDAAHNQTSKTELINGINKGTTSYTYDALNRLITIKEPNGRITNYEYDAAGNRSKETVASNGTTTISTYTVNQQNRLTLITTQVNGTTTETTTYEYDNNGNQTVVRQNNIEVSTNEYDEFNQLVRTSSKGTIISENTYNGEGLRVSKKANGTLTRYLYEYDKVVLEVDGSGNQTGRNIYGTNLIMRQADGLNLYYMYNGHADVTALIDASTGNIRASYYYDAFGNIQEQKYYTATGQETTTPINNNIMYAGYQYDEETGLYYLNARMYDPKIARFLQEDTYTGNINDPLSLNLYTYGHNNPIKYVDPTGHAVLINYDGRYYSPEELAEGSSLSITL